MTSEWQAPGGSPGHCTQLFTAGEGGRREGYCGCSPLRTKMLALLGFGYLATGEASSSSGLQGCHWVLKHSFGVWWWGASAVRGGGN